MFFYFIRNLKSNNGFKLTSNSKRLLKEFQLRYCYVILAFFVSLAHFYTVYPIFYLKDSFDGLIVELKCFLEFFELNGHFFDIVITYLRQIYFFLDSNKIPDEPQRFSITINSVRIFFFFNKLFLTLNYFSFYLSFWF